MSTNLSNSTGCPRRKECDGRIAIALSVFDTLRRGCGVRHSMRTSWSLGTVMGVKR